MSSLLEHEGRRFTHIHVVEHVDSNAGFCALMTYALNGVRKALDNDWLPVIRFDGRTARFFYDPQQGENVWDYYFEPVMGLRWNEVEAALESGELLPTDLHHYEEHEFLSWHHTDPERIATFWAKDVPSNPTLWMAQKRELGRRFVARFLRVKPHILAKADSFYTTRLAGPMTFGVHIRGTDFAYAAPTPPEPYIEAICRIAKARSLEDYRIFVATDQEQFVADFRAAFGERIVTSDAVRSTSETPPFKMKDVRPYQRGEDVLVDVLLLARCDHILKGAAAVGEYALWFAPYTNHTDFALESAFDPRHLPYLTSAFLKLNLGGYSPYRLWTARAWDAIRPWLTAPLRFAARGLRFIQRQLSA